MTKVTFEEKYYPAVKETVYKTQLSNGLTVSYSLNKISMRFMGL